MRQFRLYLSSSIDIQSTNRKPCRPETADQRKFGEYWAEKVAEAKEKQISTLRYATWLQINGWEKCQAAEELLIPESDKADLIEDPVEQVLEQQASLRGTGRRVANDVPSPEEFYDSLTNAQRTSIEDFLAESYQVRRLDKANMRRANFLKRFRLSLPTRQETNGIELSATAESLRQGQQVRGLVANI